MIANFVVNTTADDFGFSDGTTSLREAIASANAVPGQTITFDPTVFAAAQTITLSLGQLELSDTTGTETITGPTAGVTVSGGGTSRVFQVDCGCHGVHLGTDDHRGQPPPTAAAWPTTAARPR